MLYNDYIEGLVGLKGVIVKDVKNNSDAVHIQVVNKVKEYVCPKIYTKFFYLSLY